MNGIIIDNISKQYKNVKALDDVSLTFEEGKIYGLLGRNGAGKSTLIKAISNRIFVDSGKITVDGDDNVENEVALGKMHVMSEVEMYDLPERVSSYFKIMKDFNSEFDVDYAKAMAEKFKLPLNKKMKELSTGYKSIFKFISALASNCKYIFLDEPVLGLDANHRELAYRMIIEHYSETGCTIVISTHLIEEIANLLEEIIVIKNGKVIVKKDKEELLKEGYSVSGSSTNITEYIKGKNVISTQTMGGLMWCCITGEMPKEAVASIEYSRLDLQQLFIKLTSEEGDA